MEGTAECHCGALRVTVIGEPEWVNICHCKACQHRTGAVIHSGAYFSAERVSVEGASKIYTRPADSGFEIGFHFCPVCGSNVYWRASRFPRYYGVAVGAFADPTFPAPAFSVWEESMHRWLRLTPGIERFDQGRIGKPLGTDQPAG